MTDLIVRIDRCVLRVRRASGWTWGPDPDALVRAAARALPELLARHVPARIAGAATEAGRGEGGRARIPVLRLAIPATVAELTAIGTTHGSGSPATASAQVGQRISAALERAALDASIEIAPAAGVAAPDQPAARRAPINLARTEPAAAIAALLARWRVSGDLATALARLDDDVVASWRRAIDAARDARAPVASGLAATADPGPNGPEGSPAASPGGDRAWLALVAELVAAPRAPVSLERAAAVATERFGAAADPAPSSIATTPAIASPGSPAAIERATGASSPRAIEGPPSASASSTGRATGEVAIDCALPFLALFTLERTGWLAALDAALSAARARDVLPAAAFVLAASMLPPPSRGWRPTPAASAAAAAFAGLAAPPAGASLDALARLGAHLAGPLAATAHAALARGHERGSPLVAHLDPRGGHHLLESDGLFPLAWSATAPELAELAAAVDELVLVPAASASAALLERLDLGNARFITDAPPARGEPWRALPGSLWTNDTATATERLSLAARRQSELTELAAELDAEMSPRTVLAPAGAGVAARALAQGAILALADLSWNLFRAREPSTPVLALHRFADLGAQVTFGVEAIRVRIPLGRRHADLFAHRYTGEIRGVPWLDGRVVEITGG